MWSILMVGFLKPSKPFFVTGGWGREKLPTPAAFVILKSYPPSEIE
jgi:hypothetical protein